MSAEGTIREKEFCSLIDPQIQELVILARYTCDQPDDLACFTRPLLGALLSEATKTEEILDAYGARHNLRWSPLRRVVATIKLFTKVGYIFLHIRYFLPTYRLAPIGEDFAAATDQAFRFTCATLSAAVRKLLRLAGRLGISLAGRVPDREHFAEELPSGRLPSDRPSQRVASPMETVVQLATAFLNLAEDSKFLHVIRERQHDNYADLVPEPISEESLRKLEEEFHNLQSMYDTHISASNVESLDSSLPVLRGHITVIFHLLETATAFAHYYERHIPGFASPRGEHDRPVVNPGRLLDALMSYSLMFASRYILNTCSLCQEMLRRYAIHGRISVPVPRYRGFHVRPSTLIAKIVNHFGSEVRMELEEETYSAAISLELFRANEKLNARKRRRLAEEAHRLTHEERDPQAAVRRAVQNLFEQNKLVLYDRNLDLGEMQPKEGEGIEEFVTRCLVQLLTMGKIDIEMDINVAFSGDQRVLQDIKLLAENGYGEDDFGNNLPLPAKLSYLRK
jgi:hypothetical protein